MIIRPSITHFVVGNSIEVHFMVIMFQPPHYFYCEEFICYCVPLWACCEVLVLDILLRMMTNLKSVLAIHTSVKYWYMECGSIGINFIWLCLHINLWVIEIMLGLFPIEGYTLKEIGG